MKFVTIIPITFWLSILLVLGAWWAFGVGGIAVAVLLLMVFA